MDKLDLFDLKQFSVAFGAVTGNSNSAGNEPLYDATVWLEGGRHLQERFSHGMVARSNIKVTAVPLAVQVYPLRMCGRAGCLQPAS